MQCQYFDSRQTQAALSWLIYQQPLSRLSVNYQVRFESFYLYLLLSSIQCYPSAGVMPLSYEIAYFIDHLINKN